MAKKSHRILVVEDEQTLNEAYNYILTKHGYKIDTCFNGEEALKLCEKNDYDVILLDLRMPVMDGIKFLENLKIEKKPYIIVFSNYDMQTEVDQAYNLGADRYILKSWASPKELIRVVEDALANK